MNEKRGIPSVCNWMTFGCFHSQVKATHTVLNAGAILKDDIIAPPLMASTPWRYCVRFYCNLRIGNNTASVSTWCLCLDQECALVLDGKVTPIRSYTMNKWFWINKIFISNISRKFNFYSIHEPNYTFDPIVQTFLKVIYFHWFSFWQKCLFLNDNEHCELTLLISL